ncbi:DUF317 domain-containing protein [Streptomyces sp. 21So2-11]|uniref:DUF317 domain-containing protein n=1 Tax=Streptomyces sp. 21So2-11 TaxID=3144408 RepID=UPI00321A08B0
MADHTRPPYLIVPVFLAGPDPHATPTVADVLATAGWQPVVEFDSGRRLPLWRHPDGRRTARQVPCPQQYAHLPVSDRIRWEFAARTAPGQQPLWQAWFAPTTPPELTAAFAAALTDPVGDGSPQGPQPPGAPADAETLRPLAEAGWTWQEERGEHVWYSPGQLAFLATAVPADPNTPGDEDRHWVVAAHHTTGRTLLWHALGTSTTPSHLITALCRALTDPTPVPRHSPPPPGHGARTVPHPR